MVVSCFLTFQSNSRMRHRGRKQHGRCCTLSTWPFPYSLGSGNSTPQWVERWTLLSRRWQELSKQMMGTATYQRGNDPKAGNCMAWRRCEYETYKQVACSNSNGGWYRSILGRGIQGVFGTIDLIVPGGSGRNLWVFIWFDYGDITHIQLWEFADTLYRLGILGGNIPGPGDRRLAVPGARRSEHDECKRRRCQFQGCHWKTSGNSLNYTSKEPQGLKNCYQTL